MTLDQHKRLREKFESHWMAGRYQDLKIPKEEVFSLIVKAFNKRMEKNASKQKTAP